MNQGRLISIVTPTFNRAKLLAKAIESVRSQSYRSWEMLIWDDGSSDDTPQIVPTYHDPRIRYYRGPNRGQASARNQALQNAKGEYIAFLDDDDQWLPGKLARQVQILDRFEEADVLFANFKNVDLVNQTVRLSFDANRDILARMKTEPLEPGVHLIRDGFAESLSQRNIVLPSSTIMRRKICVAVGPFNEHLRGAEDMEYWWRCALRGARFAYVEEVLLVRRKGEDSFSACGVQSLDEAIKALHSCLRDAERLGREDLKSVLRRAIGIGWEDTIRICLAQGKPWRALGAFRHRCRYGITRRAVVLAACSFFGPTILRLRGVAPRAFPASSSARQISGPVIQPLRNQDRGPT